MDSLRGSEVPAITSASLNEVNTSNLPVWNNGEPTSPGGAPSTNAETVAKGDDIADVFRQVRIRSYLKKLARVWIEVESGDETDPC